MSRTLAHVQRCAICRKVGYCTEGVTAAQLEFGNVWWYALEQARMGRGRRGETGGRPMTKRELAAIDRLGRDVAALLADIAKLKAEAEECYAEKERLAKAQRKRAA